MKKRFLRFSLQLLIILTCAGLNEVAARDLPADQIQLQIRASGDALTIDVPDSQGMNRLELSIRIMSGEEVLWEGKMERASVGQGHRFSVGNLNPELWSPTEPHLYDLTCTISNKGKAIQTSQYRIGFRDVETRDGRIILNGKPIFLRGIAINPPGRGIPKAVETSRSFAEEYVRFMKSINVNIIRIPDDQTWYDVCDELGMMVFGGNYSGSVAGEKPPKDYDSGVKWYQSTKFQPIMHHPSLVIYALTNEVPYQGDMAKKWIDFLSYAHKELRKWDDTRLYIGNAGYGYGQSGDICDLHRYWGWYYASAFTFLNIRDYERITFPEKVQPLTFTECVGNYTGPDGRYNLTPNHKNPVSQLNWTGHAPASLQAQLADQHQCFVFKQATELIRRLRRINPESSGVFPFTIMFRNWHTVATFGDMDPKPVTNQARKSYQPILVSWENWQSHAYAGAVLSPIAHVINDSDDFSSLTKTKLVVRLLDEAFGVHVSDTFALGDIPYYGIHSKEVKLELPDNLIEGQYLLEGIVLSGEKVVSRNDFQMFIARKQGAGRMDGEQIKLYDASGETRSAFEKNGIPFAAIRSFNSLRSSDRVIVGENSADATFRRSAKEIKDFVGKGGRLVILRQDSAHQQFLKDALNVAIDFPRMDIDNPSYPPPARPSRNAFNINPERPDHPVFRGIKRSELRLWSDYTGWNETKPGFPAIYPVTDGFVAYRREDMEKIAVLANYSVGLEGIALAEIFEGSGSVMLSGFDIARRAGIDPIADRLLKNIVAYTVSSAEHENHVLITAPIRWGDYESEKGILSGINSGFMLNARPALYGSYEDLPILLEEDGHMYAGAKWGWNTRPGKQYVPYGRRMFGPYFHRGFGGVPTPRDENTHTGEGVFWCRVLPNTQVMETVVWNPSGEDLSMSIEVNGDKSPSHAVSAGEYAVIESDIRSNHERLKVLLRGDRRLVVLQTTFK